MTALPCPPARWPAFSRRLDALLALPPAERAAALDALPPDEAELRPKLAAVLAHEADALDDAWLTGPRLPGSLPGDAQAAPHLPGQRIGPWQLLRELGRGGMGVVWLAARADGAYVREVALKLPHRHLLENLNAAGVRERFARERDILAGLSHPHIARFYDAGVSDDQQPWLALEAVDGLPITTWCRQQALPLDARLVLFDQVAGAVAHAHGRLVAHRDLKPANVLVTADGQVKLLDFGIARLLEDGDGTDGRDGTVDDGAGALTRAQGLLATPQYAAPEQLAGGPVSVATDVYALGLMLFELLTDQPTFAGRRHDPLAEAPPASRSAGTPALRRALAGDLDAIVAQALQPRPEARYPSVAALADDLLRQRRHLPIAARRLGAAQRLGRFVRRHRLPLALGGALVLALGAGLAGVLWQAQEARAQARRAEAVKDFLLGIFSAADPRIAGGKPNGQTTAKTLLDRSAAGIDARFADDPDLRIELLRTAADIYRELGEDAAYEALQQRQLALVLQRHGPLHPNVLDNQLEAALRAYERGDHAACRARLATADDAIRRAGRDRSPLRAHWWTTRGICLRDQADQADARLDALQRSVALFAAVEPGQRGHVTALAELATEHSTQGRQSASIATNRQAIALAQALPTRNEAELQTLHANLGLALQQSGDLDGAAAAFGQAADIAERTSGADFSKAWLPRSRHARTLHLAGQRAQADAAFTRLLAQVGDRVDLPDAHVVREDAGERLAAEGRPAEGLPLLLQAQAAYQRSAQYDFDQRRVLRHIGDAQARLGQHDAALATLRQALAAFEAADAPGRQTTAACRERLGRLLLDMGRPAEARPLLQRVVDDAAVKTWSHVALAQAGLARAALAQGNQAQAQALSQQALATWAALTGFRDGRMQAHLWRVRAAVLATAGDAASAQALRDQALAAARRTDAPDSPTITQPLALGL
jgi:serine/threonine-protein kinase